MQKAVQNKTALYCRLSVDDNCDGESDSIQNQRLILQKYAKDHGFLDTVVFTDDGVSGTTFQRKGFQQMIDGIQAGEIKTVIVKDLSRFGRDYLQVGMYTEVLFPEKKVRFIAVNDNVDSATGDNDFTVLKNVFNDWFARDTSKKIKAVKHAIGMSGRHVTSWPPYGYVWDKSRRNYEVDPETAPVVKQIYALCLAGNGPMQIARILKEQNVPTPGTLVYQRTGNARWYYPNCPCKWAMGTVAHILSYKEYMGYTVNFKTSVKSYKSHHTVENDEKEQAVFPNTHEAIIDTATWERVQQIRKNRRRPDRRGEIGLFSGMLYCADCGGVLYKQYWYGEPRRRQCYVCSSYRKRTIECTAHYIREDGLKELVVDNLRQVTHFAGEYEEQFLAQVTSCGEQERRRALKALENDLQSGQRRLKEIHHIVKRLYEDNVNSKLTDEQFRSFSQDYETERGGLEARVESLTDEIDRLKSMSLNVSGFLELVRKYVAFEELTPTILHEFIEKIVVHEGQWEGKKRLQQVDIYYRFLGQIKVPKRLAKPNKTA